MSEQLIYAMSTLGEASIAKFNDIFKRLYLPEDDEDSYYNTRHQTIRYLEALGYCEFDYDNRVVYMCPPALVLLPLFGLPKALLTGARTPKLVEQLQQSVKTRKEKTLFTRYKQRNTRMNLPDATVIEAADTEVINDIASENGIMSRTERPAAWDLASHSVSLENIETNLRFEVRQDINWKRRDFNVQRLGFSGILTGESYKLSEYIHPDNLQRKHWMWNDRQAADVNRDWGRYIVLKQTGKRILFYDENAQELRVPLWVPLPCLLARAVTLCSGIAPAIEIATAEGDVPDGCPIQVYSDVPAEIARIVALKTGQKIFN